MSHGILADGAGLGDGWRAMDLFWEQFTVGEDVVVEDDDGYLSVGRLQRPKDDRGVGVRVGRKNVVIVWDQVLFVAHAGFPVKSIRGMTPLQADRLAKRFDTAEARREITLMLKQDSDEQQRKRRVKLRGGCPFDFDDVEILALNNPGQDGPRWWGRGDEEELVLRARDGALCLSYNLGHLFYLETDRVALGFAG